MKPSLMTSIVNYMQKEDPNGMWKEDYEEFTTAMEIVELKEDMLDTLVNWNDAEGLDARGQSYIKTLIDDLNYKDSL